MVYQKGVRVLLRSSPERSGYYSLKIDNSFPKFKPTGVRGRVFLEGCCPVAGFDGP